MPPDLLHAFDDEPGLSRHRAGKGFAYRGVDGLRVSEVTRRRVAKLAIPPAWTEVWICPDENGHIQATGRDARGRKQYIYHPAFRSWREETKFLRILEFAAALPALRARVAEDLTDRQLTRRLVLATAIRILEQTLIRVGNEAYAAQNGSYGLTTLKRAHLVGHEGTKLRFKFRGKHGKLFDTSFADRRVSTVLRRLEGLPGRHLLQFVDEAGEAHRIGSEDVNAYIREATGEEFSAKDFRTWAATVLAAVSLLEAATADPEQKSQKGNVRRAIEKVAARLGNTPTVCRQSYVHPEIIEGYLDGSLAKTLSRKIEATVGDPLALSQAESAVRAYLEKRIRARRQQTKKTGTLTGALEASLAAHA